MTSSRALTRAPLVLVARDDGDALPPAGVYARGAGVVAALISALRALDDATLRTLRGVRVTAGAAERDALVVVTGPEAVLPWRDGVRYLGVLVPGLYVPTTRTTSLPPSLAAEALARHLPAALIDDVIVPLRVGLPLSRASLAHLSSGAGASPGGSA